jgi:hypothetical protein
MEKILLTSFLDLYTLSNDTTKWSVANFAKNPPRLYRLQMIDALMKALEINCSYSQFIEGQFITNVQFKKWGNFKKSIEIILPQVKEILPPSMSMDAFAIGMLFSTLMRYRLFAQQLLSSNDGIYAASGEFNFFLDLMNTPNRKLIEELKKIDTVLLFCINPTAISYTKEELIANFGFPEININDVDVDFM